MKTIKIIFRILIATVITYFSIIYADDNSSVSNAKLVSEDMQQNIINETLNPTVKYTDNDSDKLEIVNGKTDWDQLQKQNHAAYMILSSMIRLRFLFPHGILKFCTGTVIKQNYILTAKHCLYDGQQKTLALSVAFFVPIVAQWRQFADIDSLKIVTGEVHNRGNDWAIIEFRRTNPLNAPNYILSTSVAGSLASFISSGYVYPVAIPPYIDYNIIESRRYKIYYGGTQQEKMQYYNNTVSNTFPVNLLVESPPLSTPMIWSFPSQASGNTQAGDSGAPLIFCTSINVKCYLIGVVKGTGGLNVNTFTPSFNFFAALPK
jgi:hypothetical protein